MGKQGVREKKILEKKKKKDPTNQTGTLTSSSLQSINHTKSYLLWVTDPWRSLGGPWWHLRRPARAPHTPVASLLASLVFAARSAGGIDWTARENRDPMYHSLLLAALPIIFPKAHESETDKTSSKEIK
jgi:hypothetical protein